MGLDTVRGIENSGIGYIRHRWLHQVPRDVNALNDRRVGWLQGEPKTRDSPRGVMAIDKTLVDYAGTLIDNVGWFWNHAKDGSVIAHDSLISNSVCPSGRALPLHGAGCRNKDACQKGEFTDHTELCIELINDAIARGISGDFTFDSSFTRAKVLHHIQSTKWAYVGDLKRNRKLVYDGREQSLQGVGKSVEPVCPVT